MRMSTELGRLLTPPPERVRVMGPAEAPVPRLKNEYRYQFLIKAASGKCCGKHCGRSAITRGSEMAGARRWSSMWTR